MIKRLFIVLAMVVAAVGLHAQWSAGLMVGYDYNSYDYAETETIDGIHGSITVYLSGDSENSLTLLIWSDDTYSYAYYAGTPMTHEQTLDFLKEQLTNESQ